MFSRLIAGCIVVCLAAPIAAQEQKQKEKLYLDPINVVVPHISTDKSVKYDYDIVYVRAKRAGDEQHKRFFSDFSSPITIEPGADLMLLHPDGKEELLVEGGDGSVTDPFISYDGEWVFYTLLHDMRKASQWEPPKAGADIYKLHLKSRKIVRLTRQEFSPNTGAADWSSDFKTPEEGKTHFRYGVYNMGPCPLPGGKVVFTSNRDGFRPAKGYPAVALQLFVMNDDGSGIEKIGHLNISGALHPVVLRDGRIMFSSLESQGVRSDILWGIWTIHPDGTNWEPLVSAFDPGGAPNGFHFQTQLTDGSLVIEEYYNQNNSGFGAYFKLPATPPAGYAFGPGYMQDPRNPPLRFGRFDNGKGKYYRLPFSPAGITALTPFADNGEGPADRSVIGDKKSPAVGKVTHPSGAPDNHLLTCYSPGPANHQYRYPPEIDGGIYLLKSGETIEAPAQMRLIKNDPAYNECWPRAVVSYQRVHGVAEPKRLKPLANDGRASPHLPAGTPFGLVGTSSFYKRESYPNGVVPEGSVTATYAGGRDPFRGLDPFTSHGNGPALNWHNQGADAGLYENDQMHAVRILVMEPTTDRRSGKQYGRMFFNHAHERLRILGEIPLRKFAGDKQPTDPDGNPDTSFLAKIPADTAFTFQTLDKDGMVLNMAQTWHHLRPGEIRNNCGGCHAHSQKPTEFELTAAAKPDYKVWDLTASVPLVTSKANDESKVRWDSGDETGLKYSKSVVNVEYHRDVRPILERSCIACHTSRDGAKPASDLDLDADSRTVNVENYGHMPETYVRLAADSRAKFGIKPVGYDSWGGPQASRYVRKFQSRRSLLTWKVYGRRLDGFSNDDHPSESKPGAGDLVFKGEPVANVKQTAPRSDVDFVGSVMPPPDAVRSNKVKPLSDEDRRTLVRWIDLGCPIDLDPTNSSRGWYLDDNRPIVAITFAEPNRVLIGLHDYYTGLDRESLSVTSTVEVNSQAAGTNLASQLKEKSSGVWELPLDKPAAADTVLTVKIKDRQGNWSAISKAIVKDK